MMRVPGRATGGHPGRLCARDGIGESDGEPGPRSARGRRGHRRAAAGLQPQHRLGQLRQRGTARAHRAGVGLGGAGLTGHAGSPRSGVRRDPGDETLPPAGSHPAPRVTGGTTRQRSVTWATPREPSGGAGAGRPWRPGGWGRRCRPGRNSGARGSRDLPRTVAAEAGTCRQTAGVATRPWDDMSRDRPAPFPRPVPRRIVRARCRPGVVSGGGGPHQVDDGRPGQPSRSASRRSR